MFHKRTIRKRTASPSSDSGSSSDGDAPRQRSKKGNITASNKKSSGILPARVNAAAALSFGDADEGNEEEFVVSKTKASRTIKKKMRQAPNASSVIEDKAQSADATASSVFAGGSYSAESLAALRSSQIFSSAPALIPEYESACAIGEAVDSGRGVELAGDDAIDAENKLGARRENVDDEVLQVKQHIDAAEAKQQTSERKKVMFSNAIPKVDNRDFRDSDDLDSAQWEKDLLKRAGGRLPLPGVDTPSSSARQQTRGSGDARSEEVTFKDCMKSLENGIEKLEENCDLNRAKLSNLNISSSDADTERIALKAKVEKMADVQDWMEDFRLYSSDVVGMMREKAETIEELSTAILQIQSDQYSASSRAFIELQEKLVADIRSAGQMLSLGGYLPQSQFLCEPVPSGVVDGRHEINLRMIVGNISIGVDASASIHHKVLIDSILVLFDTHDHGGRPDDMLTEMGGSAGADDKLSRLRGAASLLMSDVREDISSVAEILNKFSKLRMDHPSQYRSAFISLSLPPIIGELVKLDAITFPIPHQSVAFEERSWHAPLFQYSTDSVSDANLAADAPSDGDDSVLLPKVISGAVFPWILSVVEKAFDPMSRAQCVCCADMTAQLLEYDLPSEKSNAFVQKIFSRFCSQLKMFCFPSLRSNADIVSYSFLILQLWNLVCCLENLTLFKSLISPSALSKLVWHSFSSEWCRVISSLLGFISSGCDDEAMGKVGLMGAYACVRVVLGVCRNIQEGENILDVLYSQKNIGDASDAVVSATYFIQLRGLIAGLDPKYRAIGIPADGVVSATQAALVTLSRIADSVSSSESKEGAVRLKNGDVNSLLAFARKLSNSG